METIQVVLDKRLLEAADRAAKRTKKNRSALAREALREDLTRLDLRVQDERDRQGYARTPAANDEARRWEEDAIWPAGYSGSTVAVSRSTEAKWLFP